MKNAINLFMFFCFFLLLIPGQGIAQVIGADSYWSDRQETEVPKGINRDQVIKPDNYRLLSLDLSSYKNLLQTAPKEDFGRADFILELPMPDNTTTTFRIIEEPMMPASLQQRFPGIRTFRGIGVENPSTTVHLDFTHKGFHAMIMSHTHKTVYIDPISRKNGEWYMSYFRGEQSDRMDSNHTCSTQGRSRSDGGSTSSSTTIGDCSARTYRLAMACTGEYATYHGGTQMDAMAAMTTSMNRVNQIFMRDAGIRMEFVANNNNLIYLNPATDPYTSGNASVMVGENQSNIDAEIGVGGYDIGHVFDVGSGGYAPGLVCNDTNKAQGTTGVAAPVGDPFDVDFVSHEIGHQFGANHTFYSDEGNCSGAMFNATAVEPGSGSTIMAYANICAPDNVQTFSDDYFHTISLQEIGIHVTSNTCGTVNTLLDLNEPEVFAYDDADLPSGTTFTLRGNEKVNYIENKGSKGSGLFWDQVDPHLGGTLAPMPPQDNSTKGPNFRSVQPVHAGLAGDKRTFGLDPNNDWEVVPNTASDRILTFQFTSKVVTQGFGCAAYEEKNVTFLSGVGPFVLTSPSGSGVSLVAGDNLTVEWDVANTDLSPLDVNEVVISLVVNGLTYFLGASTPNDGTQEVTIPSTIPATSSAILRIVSLNTAMYDKGVSFRDELPGITITNFTGSGNTSKFVVFPNPTSDQLQIKYQPLESQLKNAEPCLEKFTLSDHSGKVILQQKWEKYTRTMNVDVSEFSNGIYSLIFFDCEGISHQEKVTIIK